ncbi:NADP-dependent oxidoreductase [Allostreptomyces psammosilenae]|uniref:NADPH:quinone reductase-like Zn-dependent oxidoreductase n=1 Tax=Allostreptomyces psammosilenae TaxID=1892865 RepID=A0A852ZRW3_9ACTN|nr:NADP-dependent oxidoreductase [Allostreptomyces psammosilenae]NYI05176.1 NADPH:quinone reductase-like Zn-dependent oxidoreductase [Allostreptomyces psammosilenae]
MTMRAAALTEFGGPEVLRPMDLPVPVAGPGQVRIAVRAAGVLPFDLGVRGGWSPPGVTPRFPVVPGNEFAGTIDQLGEGVTGRAVGEDVLGFGLLGGYAEYVVVPADQVVAKPAEMPWEIAGGFSGNGQGAHLALGELRVGPGDTLLIGGAAGGLGTFAVQLARAWGATTVIGTASPANHDYLRELGAVPVAYGEGLVERIRELAPGGVDAALDAAGPEGLRAAVEVTRDRDRVITMVATEEAARLGLRDWGGTRTAARLAELVELYRRGAVRPRLRATYPLDRAADAHRDLATGHGRGKIVLTVR